MYDKLINAGQGVNSITEFVEINNSALGKVFRQQASYVNEVIKGSVAHGKAMTEVKDLKSATAAQKAFVTTMNQMYLDTAKLNLQVVIETRDALASLMEAKVPDLQSAESRKAA